MNVNMNAYSRNVCAVYGDVLVCTGASAVSLEQTDVDHKGCCITVILICPRSIRSRLRESSLFGTTRSRCAHLSCDASSGQVSGSLEIMASVHL